MPQCDKQGCGAGPHLCSLLCFCPCHVSLCCLWLFSFHLTAAVCSASQAASVSTAWLQTPLPTPVPMGSVLSLWVWLRWSLCWDSRTVSAEFVQGATSAWGSHTADAMALPRLQPALQRGGESLSAGGAGSSAQILSAGGAGLRLGGCSTVLVLPSWSPKSCKSWG